MPSSGEVGSVTVSVVPTTAGWNDKLKEQLLPQADELGEEVGDHIKQGIEAALADTKLTIDTNIPEVESEAEELSGTLDDVTHPRDLDFEAHVDEALANVEELGAASDEVTDKSRSLDFTADTGEAVAGVETLDGSLSQTSETASVLQQRVSEAGGAFGALSDFVAEYETAAASGTATSDDLADALSNVNLAGRNAGAALNDVALAIAEESGAAEEGAAANEAEAASLGSVRDRAAEAKISLDSLKDTSAGGGGDFAGGGGMMALMAGAAAAALLIAPAFITAAAAVGVFAGAAIPDIRSLIKDHQQFALQLAGVKSEYLQLAAAVKPQVITGFDEALTQAERDLPEFTQAAKAGGVAVDGLINQLGDFVGSSDTKSFLNFVGDEAPSNVHAFGNAIQGAATFVYGFTVSLDGISKTLLSVIGGLGSFGGEVLSTVPQLGQWAAAIGAAYFSFEKLPPILRSIAESPFSQWLTRSSDGLFAFGTAFKSAGASLTLFKADETAITAEMSAMSTEIAAEMNALGPAIGDVVIPMGILTEESGAAVAEAAALHAEVAALIAELAELDPELAGVDAAVAALDAEMAAAAVEAGVLDGALAVLAAVNPLVWAAGAVVAVGALVGVLLKATPSVDDVTNALKQQYNATGYNVSGMQAYAKAMQVSGAASDKLSGSLATSFERMHDGISVYPQLSGAQQQAASQSANLGSRLDDLAARFHTTQQGAIDLAAGAHVSASALEQSGNAGAVAEQKVVAYAEAGAKGASASVQFAADMSSASDQAVWLTTRVNDLTTALKDESGATDTAITNAVSYHQAISTLTKDMQASGDKAGYLTAKQQATAQAIAAADVQAKAQSASLLQMTGNADRAAGPLETLRDKLDELKDPTAAERALLQELNAEIAALHSKSIYIRVFAQSEGGVTPTGGLGGGQLHAGGYARGGVIPGRDTGRDETWVKARYGEGMIVPEAVQKLGGPAWVDAVNREYGSSGSAPRGPRHYAEGGAVSAIEGGDTFNFSFDLGNWGGWPAGGGGWASGWGRDGLGGADLAQQQADLAKRLSPAALQAAQQAGASIAKAFRDGSLKTASQIASEAKRLDDEVRKYYTGAARQSLLGTLNRQTSAMERLADKSAAIATEIANMKQFASSVTSNLGSFSDLSSLTAPKTGETATQIGAGIQTQLAQDLKDLQNFFGIIGQAKRAGLDKTFIEQAIALGPIDGYTYLKAALAGGKKLIDEINNDEKQIAKEDKLIGRRAADIQYGHNISKGFLDGLRQEDSKLKKKMRDLGDEIAREVRKDFDVGLKIKVKLTTSGSGSGSGSTATAVASTAGGGGAGTTINGGTSQAGFTRSQAATVVSQLRDIHSVDNTLATRTQMNKLISLLTTTNAKQIGQATGTAVADALNNVAKAAAQKGRYS